MKKRKKLNRQIKYSFIISLVLLSSYLVSIVSAKYKIDLFTSHSIESKEFYFSSDMAFPDEGIPLSKNWNGLESLNISFNVKNYDNLLLYNMDNIKYQVNIEKLNDSNNEIKADIYLNDNPVIDSQILAGNKISENKYTLKVSKTESYQNLKNLKLKLVIKSVEPFVKKLTREININIENQHAEAEIINYSDYIELNINQNGDMTDKNIIYDTTKLNLDKSSLKFNDINIVIKENTNNFILPLSNYEKSDIIKIIFIKKIRDDEITLNNDIIIN